MVSLSLTLALFPVLWMCYYFNEAAVLTLGQNKKKWQFNYFTYLYAKCYFVQHGWGSILFIHFTVMECSTSKSDLLILPISPVFYLSFPFCRQSRSAIPITFLSVYLLFLWYYGFSINECSNANTSGLCANGNLLTGLNIKYNPSLMPRFGIYCIREVKTHFHK